jgi:hypothetical protein
VLVTETVKRLAARVRSNSTSHEMIPALPKNGKESVPAAADSNRAAAAIEMPTRRAVLFQLVFNTKDYLLL